MVDYEARFWRETERYHDLVEQYDRNTEITHPGYITTDRLYPHGYLSRWDRTAIKYREYRGPSII